MSLLKELQRRNVVKAGISYVLISWAILQVAAILFPAFNIRTEAMQYLFYALLIGLPLWLVFAYLYEWTPEGFRKTADIAEEDSLYKSTGKRLNLWIIGGLLLVISLLVVDRIFNISSEIMKPSTELNTIAVLPFSNESSNVENEFFVSGIHSDISIKLSGIQNFRIISKSFTMEFRDFKGDLKELGQRLKARYILEGSVRREKEQVRIIAQLVDAENNLVVWSDQYDEELKDVFAVQSRIANNIATELNANLSKGESEDLTAAPTAVLSAYDDFLKAKFILDQPRPVFDDIIKAIGFLESAVAADPRFSRAWTLLIQANSEIYTVLNRAGGREEERDAARVKAEEALAQAKEISPEGWEVLQEEAIYQLNIKEDYIEALRLFEKAIERNPSDVYSLYQTSKLYSYFGSNMSKMISLLERAFELSPINGPYGFFLSFAYEMAGDYRSLIAHLNRLRELNPADNTFPVEIAYFQFLVDGKLSSFQTFEKILAESEAEHPWDERALKNREMVVAMFKEEFDNYNEKWNGKFQQHQQDHGGHICPMVANDYTNHARIMLDHGHDEEAHEIIADIKQLVTMPVNLNSVCQFNSETYIPKLDWMSGDTIAARNKLEKVVVEALKNESVPIGAVEKTVVLEAADLIAPKRIYHYYELLSKEAYSYASFEMICANPWTFPNLIQDPQFIEDIRRDGRFVEFLQHFEIL